MAIEDGDMGVEIHMRLSGVYKPLNKRDELVTQFAYIAAAIICGSRRCFSLQSKEDVLRSLVCIRCIVGPQDNALGAPIAASKHPLAVIKIDPHKDRQSPDNIPDEREKGIYDTDDSKRQTDDHGSTSDTESTSTGTSSDPTHKLFESVYVKYQKDSKFITDIWDAIIKQDFDSGFKCTWDDLKLRQLIPDHLERSVLMEMMSEVFRMRLKYKIKISPELSLRRRPLSS
jgi:hypothetical protein